MTFRRFVIWILPLLIWMLIIFGGSTDAGSATHTRSALERLLASLPVLHDLPHSQLLSLDYAIRKAAHITEYAVLAWLFHRALRQDRQTLRPSDFWGAFCLCVLYAATDEYHQTFTKNREGVPRDVLYDAFGAGVGVAIAAWYRNTKRKE